MLDILSISKECDTSLCTVKFSILENGTKKELWLKVDKQYSDGVVLDRIDGIMIGLLNYAMRNGHDIISRLPISDRLFYNLTKIVIPILAEANPKYYCIQIKCPSIAQSTCGFAVGTGISCGVDSLFSLASAQKNELLQFRVTHLVFNNVGQHGDNKVAQKRFEDRKIITEEFANEFGLKLVECDTNYHLLFPQNHFHSHTYANLFPVITLGNLFGVYYYASSGIKYSELDLSCDEPGCLEPFLLPLLSTSQLVIYSGGANTTRIDKLRALSDYKPANKYLQVCVYDNANCGRCEKCVRTLVGLDAIDAIDKFGDVFDVAQYKANHDWYMAQLYYYYLRGHHDYKEPYKILKKKVKISIKIKTRMKIILEDFVRYVYPIKKAILPNVHIYKQH